MLGRMIHVIRWQLRSEENLVDNMTILAGGGRIDTSPIILRSYPMASTVVWWYSSGWNDR